ncbi:hypothetical protein ACLBR5_23090 [Escherichia coli]
MSRTRQSKPNRSRTVASNVAAAVVGKVVVAVNSNHAVGRWRKICKRETGRSRRRLGDAKLAGEQQRRRRPRKPAAAQ